MSVQAVSWVIECSRHRGGALVVLIMIANHARSDGTGAWPSIDTLGREARMHPRNVIRLIPKLVRSGELTVENGAGPRGTNLYSLPMVKASTADKLSGCRGDKMSSRGVTKCREEVTNPLLEVSPEPSLTVHRTVQDKNMAPAEPRPSPLAFVGTHFQISERQDRILGDAFPWVDRQAEYRRADSWAEASPGRRPKKVSRFMHNWFSKIQAPPRADETGCTHGTTGTSGHDGGRGKRKASLAAHTQSVGIPLKPSIIGGRNNDDRPN